jgi:hypothetical protein
VRLRIVSWVVVSSVALLLLVGCNSGDLPGKKKSESEQAQQSVAPSISSPAPLASPAVAEPSEER